MSHRFKNAGWPRSNEIISGVTITASATPHAEGTYTEIDASTAQDVTAFGVMSSTDTSQTGVDTSMLLTLAVGAAASEVDVVANVATGGRDAFAGPDWFPLHIPAGTRIAGKLRAEQISETYPMTVILLFGSRVPAWGGFSACDSYGADTANSTGTAISNTAGTYTQITASTTNPLRAVSISFGLVDNAAAANQTMNVDIGVGGAGSEVIVGTWQVRITTLERISYAGGPPWIEVPIATGSRIAVKKDNTSDLACVVHGWR